MNHPTAPEIGPSARVRHAARASALLLALCAVPWLLLGGSGEFAMRSWQITWNLGHVGLFGCLVFATAAGLRPTGARRAGLQAATLLLLAGALAIAIEVVQGWVGRDRSWHDVHLSLAGAGLGLLPTPLWRRMAPRGATVSATLLVAGALLAWTVGPLAIAWYDERQASRQFPVLADFSTPFELDRWGGDSERSVARHGDRSMMRVELSPGPYPGIVLEHFPGDWRGYAALTMTLHTPEPLPLDCRVNDRRHDAAPRYRDRFNARYELPAGRSVLTLDLEAVRRAPAGRTMDMHEIDELQCFVTGLGHALHFWVESLVLTPGETGGP